MSYFDSIRYSDSTNLDAFGRLKVGNPTTIFDAQFTYDLQPLLYEEVKDGAGADVTHDSTNRRANIVLSATPAGGYSSLVSYEHFRYQPGKSQEVYITFTIGAKVADVLCYAGLGDGINGFFFWQKGDGTLEFKILSGTGVGDQTAVQANWNLDTLDGNGASGKTLDITLAQILYIDFQALYTGRVRFGFVIDGVLIFAHEFLNANAYTTPYIQTANLPIRVGMTNLGVGNVTKTMYFNCSSVVSNGGQQETVGYEFSTPDTTVTAASGAQTHLISLRPRTTFNSITNRVKVAIIEVDILVTGTNPVYWELCIGQAFSAAPTYANVNATYSAMDYGTGGTLSGAPTIVIDSGYVPASNQTKGTQSMTLTSRYPITLDDAGAVRTLGTITLLVTGIGGTSATRGVIKFKEIR